MATERVMDLDPPNKLVRGRDGWFVANSNDAYIGRSLIRYGEFSPGEMNLFRQLLRPGNVVAEIGANVGSHTVGLAREVGPSGRILAYEPQPIVFQNLCANLTLNGLTNVETRNCALGEDSGTTIIPSIRYDQEGNFGGFSLSDQYQHGTSVEVRKLDDEGMEETVLRGAEKTIERCRPVLYVENDRVDRSESLIRQIMGFGYRSWWHMPSLFSKENFFGETENIFGNLVSINLVCLHESVTAQLEGFRPVTDPSEHPLHPKV